MHLTNDVWLSARKLYDEGDYISAQRQLQFYCADLRALSAHDTFVFGAYPIASTSKPSDFQRIAPVTWEVLKKDGPRRLVIAKDCLDWEFFNGDAPMLGGPVSLDTRWSQSYLRELFSETMFPAMFSEQERAAVLTTVVKTGEERTKDKLFLLSAEEVERFFPKGGAGAELTLLDGPYDEDGRHFSGENFRLITEPYCYWLRTPGKTRNAVAVVDEDGFVNENGIHADADEVGVRPAMWLNTDLIRVECPVRIEGRNTLAFAERQEKNKGFGQNRK